MKKRNGFVSNSSSASFVVAINDLTETQVALIKEHMAVGAILNMHGTASDYNEWRVSEEDDNLTGRTMMDNFDMEEFMRKIGVDMEKVDWDW
jgi:hypothetical protein